MDKIHDVISINVGWGSQSGTEWMYLKKWPFISYYLCISHSNILLIIFDFLKFFTARFHPTDFINGPLYGIASSQGILGLPPVPRASSSLKISMRSSRVGGLVWLRSSQVAWGCVCHVPSR